MTITKSSPRETEPCRDCGGDATDHALTGCVRDYCRHGVFVGGSGIDWMCFACEQGDDEPEPEYDIGTCQNCGLYGRIGSRCSRTDSCRELGGGEVM